MMMVDVCLVRNVGFLTEFNRTRTPMSNYENGGG